MKALLLIFSICFIGLISFAQVNDNCSGAIIITPNGTCYNASTLGSNDSWTGTVGCQSNGSHPDVWYSFVATGSTLAINLTAGTMTGNVEFVLVSGSCTTGFTLTGSLCGASPLSGNINGLQVGATYYFTVSSSGNAGSFSVCVTNTNPPTTAGQDCNNAAILCTSTSISQTTSNTGFGAQEVSTLNSCWGVGGERQSKWFKFTIGCSGTLEFNINPVVAADDYDWALWNITSNPTSCSTKGNSIACNWSGCSGSTGISSCINSEPGKQNCGTSTGGDPCGAGSNPRAWGNWSTPGGGFSSCISNTINVTAGSTYALLVDNFSISNSGFNLSFGGACAGGTAKIGPNAEFTYTVGVCGTYNFTKTCQTTNSTFLWNFGDGFTSSSQNPSHTYTTFGPFTISLTVTDALGCSDTYSQTINIIASPLPTVTTPVTYCQGSAASALTATGSNLLWYTTATLGTGVSTAPVPSTATPGTTTYYVSQTVSGCESPRAPITVVVNPSPVMTSAITANICSGTALNIPLSASVNSSFSWVATDNINLTGESISAQSSSIINNTITNTGSSVETLIYTVTPTSNPGGCVGASQVITVTINPAPSLTNPLTATVCSGTALNISLTSNIAGATFSWIAINNTNTTGETISSQSSSNITDIINSTSSVPQIVTYNVTPSAGGCQGATQNISVTVNPLPTILAIPTNVCSGVPLNISLSANIPSTFTWIANPDNINIAGESLTLQSTSSITNTLTLIGLSSQTVNYIITPTSTVGACVGNPQNLVVTVNPIPVMTSITAASVCSAVPLNFSLSSDITSTYTWIATDNLNVSGESITNQTSAIINNTITNTSGAAQLVTYSVIPQSNPGGCYGSSQIVTITVNPAPQITSPINASICSGNSPSITLTSNILGSTFTWIAANNISTVGESTSLQSSSIINDAISNNSNSTQTVIYTVNSTFSGCIGPNQTVNVAVAPLATITSAVTKIICSNVPVGIVFASNVVGASYTWLAATDNPNVTGESLILQNSGSITDILVNTSTIPQTVSYTVIPSISNCAGTPQTITITINPIPSMTSGASISICSGVAFNFPFSSNISANYSWIAVNNPSTTGESLTAQNSNAINNTIINTSGINQNVIYNVTPTSVGGNCLGAAQQVTVAINPAPVMTNANSASICGGNALNILLTSNIPADYTWSAADNPLTSGESITAQIGNTINDIIINNSGSPKVVVYTVTPTSQSASGCIGTPQTINVTVNSTPVPTFGYSNATYCQTGTDPIAIITGTTGGTFSASPVGLSFNINTGLIDLSASVLNSYTITYSLGGACPASSTFGITITVAPDASFSYVGPYCTSGPSITPTFPIGSSAGVFSANGTGLIFSNSTTGEIDINASTAGVYLVTNTILPAAGCALATSTNSITLIAPPTNSIAGANQNICGYIATMAANTASSGSGLWSLVSGVGTITNPTNPNTTITGLGAGNNTFRWTITSSVPCVASFSDVIVTTNAIPQMTNTAANSICSGTGTAINLTSNIPSTFSWVALDNNNITGETLIAQSTTSISDLLVNSSNVNQIVTYQVTPTAGICQGATQNILITVSPVAVMTNPASTSICSGNNVGLTLSSNIASTYSWSASDNSNTTGESILQQSSVIINDNIINNTTSPQLITYTVSPSANGCIGTSQTLVVTVNPTANMTNASAFSICSGQSPNIALTSNIAASYSWVATNNINVTGESISAQSATTISDILVNNSTTDQLVSYAVTPSANGCAGSTQNISVTVKPNPNITGIANTTICSNQSVGFALSSDISTTFNWIAQSNSNISGESLLAQSTSIINDLLINNTLVNQTVIYTVTPTANSCPGTPQNINVIIKPLPSVNSQNNTTICSGTSVSINLSSDIVTSIFSWIATNNINTTGESLFAQSASTINDIITNNTNSTQTVVYSVSPSASGCNGIPQSVTVTINPVPNPSFNYASGTLCQTGIDQLPNITGTLGGNFSASPSGLIITPNSGLIDVSASALNSYTITYSIAGICPASSTFPVTITTAPDASFSYAGPYCQSAVNPLPTFIPGASAGIFSSNPIGVVFVNNSTGEINLAASLPGNYSITNTIIAAGGCAPASSNNNITIVALSSVANAGPLQTICTSSTTLAANAPLVGAGMWTLVSGTGNINNPSSPNTTVTGLGIGNNIFRWTISATAPCIGSTSDVTITVNPADDPSFSYSSPIVCRAGGNISPLITGLPGGSFTASPSSLAINVNTGIIDPGTSLANNYIVTYTTNGTCPSSTTANITILDIPLATFSYSSPFCTSFANATPNFIAGAIAGTFTSTPIGLVFANPNNGEINFSASQEGIYTLTNTIIASATCPAVSESNIVIIVQAPSASNAGIPQTICGTTATIVGNTPAVGSGIWSLLSGSGNILSPNSTSTEIRNLSPGNNVFQWTITSNAPCPSTSSQVTITTIPLPVMTSADTASICSGQTVSINLSSNVPCTYSWVANDNIHTYGESLTPVTSSILFNTIYNQLLIDQFVLYNITPVSSAGNCAGLPQNVIVVILPPVKVNAGRDSIAVLNQPYQLQATGAVNYLWSPVGPLNNPFIADPIAMLSNDTRFIVEGTNILGCKGYDTLFVKVYEGPTYYVPNTFTPNGDGLNDIFTPIPVGIVSTEWFRVYNRWGQLLFESSEWLKGWDGRYHGIMQPTGAYVWTIKGHDIYGKEITAKGTVLLLH